MTNLLKLKKIVNSSIVKFNEPLKKYSFTKTGGESDALVIVNNYNDLKNIINFAKEENIDITVLGNGSNVLISDKGIRGITILTSNMNNIEILENNIISCESGATLKELTDFCIENSFTNLEFACGIPGSIGGGTYMNAGAYGGELKEVIIKVETIDYEGNTKLYSNQDMQFSYRYSIIQEKNEIITKIYFKLEKGNKTEIINKVNELNKIRAEKQPLEHPSCGSVFKRPEGSFAGKLIQDSGCQGLRIGGAEVSKKHAGFMVNIDNASCNDYIELINTVQKKVLKDTGIYLEREVKILGEK